MKYTASIKVLLKNGVLDPQGETIGRALKELGFESISRTTTGKIFKLEIEADTEAQAKNVASDAAAKLLANPVIERYEVEVIR